MTIKIEKRIVDYRVAKEEGEPERAAPEKEQPTTADIIHMHEQLKRPVKLRGSTYKVEKNPATEHALYVTINDIVLNEGTEHELRRPFEIFVNSKSMDHFQWIVALTRIMSAVFRKGGDVTFLVEELHSVFDPRGGYFKKGGRYVPSLVAELGDIVECHLKDIGMLDECEMDGYRRDHVETARAKYEAANGGGRAAPEDSAFPEGATLCGKCQHQAVVLLDGCMPCLNCGESKCG